MYILYKSISLFADIHIKYLDLNVGFICVKRILSSRFRVADVVGHHPHLATHKITGF